MFGMTFWTLKRTSPGDRFDTPDTNGSISPIKEPGDCSEFREIREKAYKMDRLYLAFLLEVGRFVFRENPIALL